MYCPSGLLALLNDGNQVGMTMTVSDGHTLTVLGDAKDRSYAKRRLVPVILMCLRRFGRGRKEVHVTYCDACGDRVLPAKHGTPLASEHVNGGVTMDRDMGVLVFRRQDAQKVLVHELMHLFGMDESIRGLDSTLEKRVVRDRPGLWSWRGSKNPVPIALSEAYTDAIACIIYCDGDLVRARQHAVSTASKVLEHFGWGTLPFSETTHAFSYYVVKAAMLVSLDTNGMAAMLRPAKTGIVGFMDRSLHSVEFRDSLLVARSLIGRGRGGGRAGARAIHMSDGRPMVF